MGRWRSKLLMALIVYAAGFASAIYVLSPAQATESGQNGISSQWAAIKDLPKAGFEAKPWAEQARAAIGKAAVFAKEQSVVLADAIKTKVEQNQRDRDQ